MYGLLKIANEKIIKDYSFFEQAMERGEPVVLDNLTNDEGLAFTQALMDRSNRMGDPPTPKQLKMQSAVLKGQEFLVKNPFKEALGNATQFAKKHPVGLAAAGLGTTGAGLGLATLSKRNSRDDRH